MEAEPRGFAVAALAAAVGVGRMALWGAPTVTVTRPRGGEVRLCDGRRRGGSPSRPMRTACAQGSAIDTPKTRCDSGAGAVGRGAPPQPAEIGRAAWKKEG